MSELIQQQDGFEYVRVGRGPNLLLLHGLFGALSNWQPVLEAFQHDHTVWIPLLPIYRPTKRDATLEGLVEYIDEFVERFDLRDNIVVGNSLGGHLGMMYTMQRPNRVARLVLTGSSGLFEAGMGVGFVRRGDPDFIRDRVAFTFYDPKTASKELVDEVFEIVNNRMAAMRILNIARAAQRMHMAEQMRRILVPTCLVWGLNDNITPPYVAHEFHRLIPKSELHFIDHCGHAAMMEQPERFNIVVREFLAHQVQLQS